MKKILWFLCLVPLVSPAVFGQRKCGMEQYKAALIARYPSWEQKIEAQRTSLQGIADDYRNNLLNSAAKKTTAASPVPVIFHILVTAHQLAQMGGYDSLTARCDSQIAVLNRDFNRQNADSVKIPSLWKPLYGKAGIHFGLAHTAPNGWGTPGYEVTILTSDSGFYPGSSGAYAEAKHNNSHGVDAWDVTKYLNVWCFNFADGFGNLGITIAPSFTPASPVNEEGICITWLALGTQTNPPTLTFPPHGQFTAGRTLTHEMGHFFEIWHTWGDDNNKCSWSVGGLDDGIADTPPEAGAKYGVPTDTIPGGTIYDACMDSSTVLMQPIGVGSLDFMNYTDDVAMFLFTPMQAAVMASMVAPGGESYSLTQHPELLAWPANAGVSTVGSSIDLNISPNPSTGIFLLTFHNQSGESPDITVLNTLGRQVQHFATGPTGQNLYSIDLSGMSKGIYFVRCNFASGSITRKILVQ